MDAKLQHLLAILDSADLRPWPQEKIEWRPKDWDKNPHAPLIAEAYGQLGGTGNYREIHPGQWDILISGHAIALDDALHFNRYRKTTLRSPLYDKLPDFPLNQYRRYIQQYENECLKAGSHGDHWSHREALRHFAAAEAPGELYGPGSPAWKYLAIQEMMKDAIALHRGHAHVHIPVYDTLLVSGKMVSVKQVLSSRQSGMEAFMLAWLSRKLPQSLQQKDGE